jgi:hypothetical protein
MGVFLKPSNNVFISVIQLESGINKIWVDRVLNSIIHRIP